MNQGVGKIAIYAPVSFFIGIGQCAARDMVPDTHVIQLLFHRAQTAFDVTEAVAVSELSKCHARELVKATK